MEWYYRRRWWRWFSFEFNALGVSRRAIADPLGFPPARISEWLNERRGVSPHSAFGVGQLLARLGSKTANGPIALLASGHLIETFEFLQQLVIDAEPHNFADFVVLASSLRRWTRWLEADGYSLVDLIGNTAGETDPNFANVSYTYMVITVGEPADTRHPGLSLENVQSFNADKSLLERFDKSWARPRQPKTPVEGPNFGKLLFAEKLWGEIESAIAYCRYCRSRGYPIPRFADTAWKLIAPITVEAYNRTRPLLGIDITVTATATQRHQVAIKKAKDKEKTLID